MEEPKHGGDGEAGGPRGDTGAASREPNQAFLIWQANERPQGIPFNLTPFVVTFNHIDDNLRPWLAPTDSRLPAGPEGDGGGPVRLCGDREEPARGGPAGAPQGARDEGPGVRAGVVHQGQVRDHGRDVLEFNGEYWKRRERAGPDGDTSVWEGLEKIY